MAGRGLPGRFATIRARTTAAACIVVAAALALGAVVVVVVLRHALERNIVDAARTRAAEVAGLVVDGSLPASLAVPVADESVVQVVDSGGAVVAASANVEGASRISRMEPVAGRTETETTDRLIVENEPEDRFHVLALGGGDGRETFTVYVATSLEPVDESIAAVRRILLVALPLVLLVVALTSWAIVGLALRPVDSMREEVDDISESELGRRVVEPRADDEIGRLARGMNRMLDRLQSSTDRQHRFVADASHELQSPLASSLAHLEVALAHPDETDWVETGSALVADNQRMSRTVQDLLFLARSDSGRAGGPRPLVDLDDVVLAEVERVGDRFPVDVEVSSVSPVEVRADPDQLGRVVRNLVENAGTHARSTIVVSVAARDTTAELVVDDDGPGVPEADRERIFERFTRLDASRSRATGGAGLGLAIAREIVERHGGTLVAAASPMGGARFVVRLPRTGATPGPS